MFRFCIIGVVALYICSAVLEGLSVNPNISGIALNLGYNEVLYGLYINIEIHVVCVRYNEIVYMFIFYLMLFIIMCTCILSAMIVLFVSVLAQSWTGCQCYV